MFAMEKKIIRITESKLRNIVEEKIKKRLLKEGVGTPALTNAYKNIVDSICTIVTERAKIELGEEAFRLQVDAADSMDVFREDVQEYTRKYVFPAINKIYDVMFSNYDMLGSADAARENGTGTGMRNWK